jgi:hypothetical protein
LLFSAAWRLLDSYYGHKCTPFCLCVLQLGVKYNVQCRRGTRLLDLLAP